MSKAKSKQAGAAKPADAAAAAAVAAPVPAEAEPVVAEVLSVATDAAPADLADAVVSVDGEPVEGAIGTRGSGVDSVLEWVTVRTKGVPSRRRAGRGFTAAPTTIAADELDADQLQALLADPYLDVQMFGT